MSIVRVAGAVLRWAACHAKAREREWLEAAASEIGFVEDRAEARRYAVSAMWLAVKGVNMPGLFARSRMALATVVIAGVALIYAAMADVPKAVRMAASGWSVGWQSRVPQEHWQEVARRAEEQKDAQALAFAALRLRAQGVGYAEKAAAMDPQYTWVLYYAVGTTTATRPTFRYSLSAEQREQYLAELRAWDPGNAAIEMEAASVARMQKDDAQWRAHMKAAMAADHYDSYVPRGLQLGREYMKRDGDVNPMDRLWAIIGFPLPSLPDAVEYTRELLASNDPQQWWAVAHFAHVMRDGASTDIEEAVASSIARNAYRKLLASGTATQHEREMMKAEIGATEFREKEMRDRNNSADWFAYRADAFAMDFAFVALALAAGMMLCPAVLSLVRRKMMAVKVALGGAVTALFAVTVLALTYAPYAELLEHEKASTAATQIRNISLFWQLADAPMTLRQMFYVSQLTSFSWMVIIAALLGALLFIAGRNVRRWRTV